MKSKSLSPQLRKQLSRAVQNARRVSEDGARKVLQACAVDRHEPHNSMSNESRKLRNRLRAHGRQLGDILHNQKGTQEIIRLGREVAYRHWHRMLFARFLAENNLLLAPDTHVAVTIDECRKLAHSQGEDTWILAARFAQDMLPAIFRPEDTTLEIELPLESVQKMGGILDSLLGEIFIAPDALGWTYQFWQEERKNQINKSGKKIGADEIPVITQLFTEDYMVRFLFHNTIGAWYAGRILQENPSLARDAKSELELREHVSLDALGGYDFSYLRFFRESLGTKDSGLLEEVWKLAAGSFKKWPVKAADLRILDPCCGSGHFLVEGLEIMVRLRMEEEGLSLEEAVQNVLKDNLYGLEIDSNCAQIAAFNLVFSAWRLIGKPVELPPLQISCTGLAIRSPMAEWTEIADGDSRLSDGMENLYELFRMAPFIGSLIDPSVTSEKRQRDIYGLKFSELQPLLAEKLNHESKDDDLNEIAIAAQGMTQAAELLSGQYTLVITNVPYLHRKSHADDLKSYATKHHNSSKSDLATMFVHRNFGWLGSTGTQAVVTPQNWLSLENYKAFRSDILGQRTLDLVAWLGTGAFGTISGHVVNVSLNLISALPPNNDWKMACIDISDQQVQSSINVRERSALLKGECIEVETAKNLEHSFSSVEMNPNVIFENSGCVEDERNFKKIECHIYQVLQADQLRNPSARILSKISAVKTLLLKYCHAYQGIVSGDILRFGRKFWEVYEKLNEWEFQQSTVEKTEFYSGREHVLFWEGGTGILSRSFSARIQGHNAFDRQGVAVSQIGLSVTLYTGGLFDSNTSALIANDERNLMAIWAFVSSSEYVRQVRRIDQQLKVTNATLVQVPFDIDRWKKVAEQQYPDGLPDPQSDDPTQWLFHGHPAKAKSGTELQVAVARLLGYRWPPERDVEMHLAEEAREWVEHSRCMDALTDEDGIVCLESLRGEDAAANRLRVLLAIAFGDRWSVEKEQQILTATPGNFTSLEDWLRDGFFEEHCNLFHHRPFIWHIWDGRKDGFHALVNYHLLAGSDGRGRRTLESLAYSYLNDWIERQRAAQKENEAGADGRLAAAQDLQNQLKHILEGGPPYDLFVRWKPLWMQPVGWEPDIDDGVRINIRSFMSAELQKGGRAGAGVLRCKPTIGWSKDRGKERKNQHPAEDYPWFYGCTGNGPLHARTNFIDAEEFDGNRWNDLHYTNSVKKEARENSARQAVNTKDALETQSDVGFGKKL